MRLESNAQSKARDKARTRSQTSRHDWLVVLRTDHPKLPGPHWYAIAAGDKTLWAADETLIATYRDGELLEDADPPPAYRPSLADLPIFKWAWTGDAADLERVGENG